MTQWNPTPPECLKIFYKRFPELGKGKKEVGVKGMQDGDSEGHS